MEIVIVTNNKRQVIDITDEVEKKLSGDGIVSVFVKHTTAAITTADLDPGTDKDFLDAILAMTPNKKWSHPHNPEHFPDHMWHSIIGPQVTVPFKNGKLKMGTWQRVVLLEFDGPRKRIVELTPFK